MLMKQTSLRLFSEKNRTGSLAGRPGQMIAIRNPWLGPKFAEDRALRDSSHEYVFESSGKLEPRR